MPQRFSVAKIKQIIERYPTVAAPLRRIATGLLGLSRWRKVKFRPADYWESRYAKGGDSGWGSYGLLAEFKAEVLNRFIQLPGVHSVVELGCGDGNQLSLLRCPNYIGLDISPKAIELCQTRFVGDSSRTFVVYHPGITDIDLLRSDLALSLDVIYHLVEERTFSRYMTDLFRAAVRYVVIYSDDVDRPGESVHIRHRKFRNWIANNCPGWELLEHIPNPYPYNPDKEGGKGSSWAEFWIYEKRIGNTNDPAGPV